MWTCLKCGTKVDPGFDVCWQCGTARDGTEDPGFVPADEAGPIEDDPGTATDAALAAIAPRGATSELRACYQAFSLIEAKFLADRLNEQDIHAVSDEQDMQDSLGGWTGNPRVYCHEDDLPRARAFLAEYERKKGEHNPLEP